MVKGGVSGWARWARWGIRRAFFWDVVRQVNMICIFCMPINVTLQSLTELARSHWTLREWRKYN